MSLSILYRGSLSSCNYSCGYCPFAKQKNSRAELAIDKAALIRFVSWVEQQQLQQISILFTPWGEALIRNFYRDAIIKLSQLEQVKKVAIQTNFSCSTSWLTKVNKKKTAFWITYHPEEIKLNTFIKKCQKLDQQAIKYSVGIVGIKQNFDAIKECRKALNPEHYLWINAYKREKDYYSKHDIQLLTEIDPHFMINNQSHPSYNKPCLAGETVIAVNEKGDATRCHFIKEKIGNIYTKDFSQHLKARLCTNQDCGCYIGYIHMPHLDLESIYGDKILERIAIHEQ